MQSSTDLRRMHITGSCLRAAFFNRLFTHSTADLAFSLDGIERVRARRRREDRVFPASGLHDAGNSILQFQRVLRGYHEPLFQMDSSALRAFLRAVRRGAGPGRFPVSCDHIDRCRIYSYEVHRQIYRRAAWIQPFSGWWM